MYMQVRNSASFPTKKHARSIMFIMVEFNWETESKKRIQEIIHSMIFKELYYVKAVACLKHLEIKHGICKQAFHYLILGVSNPCIYGLPRVHKDGVPLKLISKSTNSVTNNISKHLAADLEHSDDHIQTSEHFTVKIRGRQLDTKLWCDNTASPPQPMQSCQRKTAERWHPGQ